MKRRYWLLPLLMLPLAGLALLDRAFPLPHPAAFSTVVLAADGTPLRRFADTKGVWRYPVTLEEVSPVYLELLLGYEDRWFYQHPGVNPLALLRAATQNLIGGQVISGGSTLSMQVARLLEPHPRTLSGKLQQSLRALQLEWHRDKDEILALYLNLAPFGGPLEGVQAASYHYFGKPARTLSDGEAALLAVLPQRPSDYRPDRHPQAARAARDKVLRRMGQLGLWPETRIQQALAEPLITLTGTGATSAPLLARRLHQAEPTAQRIETLIDSDLQRELEVLLADYARQLPPAHSAALLLVDNRDLSVRAYLGSADFHDQARFGHVDMLTAPRSPGSTLKPFVYGMALDRGLIHSASLLADIPRARQAYQPGNFSGGFNGPVRADEALWRSLNLPAVQLMEALGPAEVAAHLQTAGLTLQGPGAQSPNLSLVLGGIGVELEQLVGLYSALARGGLAGRPRLQAETPIEARYLMSPGAAWILWDSLRRRPHPGLSQVARSRWSLAWKTGTSYGSRDAWAIGVSPRWTLGVWVGRPDGSSSPGQFGRASAAPLLFQAYARIRQPQEAALPRPDSVTRAEICWPLGTRADSILNNHHHNCMQRQDAWLLDQQAPRTLPPFAGQPGWGDLLELRLNASGARISPGCSRTAETTQKLALWPSELEAWLAPDWRRAARLPPLAAGCPEPLHHARPLRIQSASAALRVRARDNPELHFTAEGGSGTHSWFLDGRWLGQGSLAPLHLARAGTYQLVVVDEAGQNDRLEIRVTP